MMKMMNSERTALNVTGVGSLRFSFGESFGIVGCGGEAKKDIYNFFTLTNIYNLNI